MKKTYAIEVDCANCANLMEEAANKTEGVAKATVNFMTQKMIVEFADGADAKSVMKDVLKACKKVRNRAVRSHRKLRPVLGRSFRPND